MEQTQPCRMLWQKRKDGGARLLRMYGASSRVVVPSRIAGRPCVEIAPYCFAGQGHLPKEEDWEEEAFGGESGLLLLKELCGSAIEEAILPDTVHTIGSCAFYQCKNLKRLTVGAAADDIGSDAFMNALSLRQILLRCGPDQKSGIRQILLQISSDLQVRFETEAGIQALLLYPEYYETYDEIAPAHLFGRNISGEGFRARQAFRDQKVDFAGYDAVFLQACAEETEETLFQMALGRLQYPFALSECHRASYRNFLQDHMTGVAARLTRQKDMDALLFLCREQLLHGAELSACIQAAAEAGWPQGAAALLRQAPGRRGQEKRYEF